MYPYLLTIIADGQRFTTRHKTYGEAVAFRFELENKLGGMVSIKMKIREELELISW